MNQRVMIAMALAGQPDLLVADEPTTALDATIQAQILELLGEIRRDSGMALVLISHDLGVVAENTDRVCVMYAGRIVEDAPIDTVFDAPAHPYTQGPAGRAARARRPAPRADADRGRRARAVEPAAGLQLRAALRPRASPPARRAPPPRDRAGAPTIASPASAHDARDALLEVSDLSRTYEVRRGALAVRQGGDLARRRRRVVRAAGRPHARPGGRIGLRQDDDGQAGARAGAADRRRGAHRAARPCRPTGTHGMARAAAAHADGLPGSAGRARPAPERRPAGHGAAGDPRPRRRGRAARARRWP